MVFIPPLVPRACWPTKAQPTQLDRIEAKLDALIAALAEEAEEEDEQGATLDGQTLGGERDQGQPL